MKKRIVTMVLAAALAITTLTSCTEAKEVKLCNDRYCTYCHTTTEHQAKKLIKTYVKDRLKKGKYKKWKVTFVDEKKVTEKYLKKAKKTHKIVVGIDNGYVMSKNYWDGITKEGYYISYHGMDDKLQIGNEIRSYFVYNPGAKYTDDIIRRDDRLVSKRQNHIGIERALGKSAEKGVYYYDCLNREVDENDYIWDYVCP